jgi:hypothetical protein
MMNRAQLLKLVSHNTQHSIGLEPKVRCRAAFRTMTSQLVSWFQLHRSVSSRRVWLFRTHEPGPHMYRIVSSIIQSLQQIQVHGAFFELIASYHPPSYQDSGKRYLWKPLPTKPCFLKDSWFSSISSKILTHSTTDSSIALVHSMSLS